MKTFYISDGQAYRNGKFHCTRLTASDRYYLRKTTNYIDSAWVYFSNLEVVPIR